ncbi:hypothetical protein SBRCBS47491_009014 [Sporothrix bragantina]|uniref:Uncharacterized protein n=1 Tax=Sporothrix bragantina TaxID=671064 RepID=A0ABP0CRV4_9PEZI
MDRPPGLPAKDGHVDNLGGSMGGNMGSSAASNPISYNRDASTVNQTPSTPLLLDPVTAPQLDASIPDVPPPSYEEATGISPRAPSPATIANANRPVPPLPTGANSTGTNSNSNNLAVPNAGRPLRAAASSGHLGAGGMRRTSAGSNTSVRTSGSLGAGRPAVGAAGAAGSASSSALPNYQNAAGAYGPSKGGAQQQQRPGMQGRPATSAGAAGGSRANSSRPIAAAAPGSVPRGRQFPAAFNLYGDNYSRTYFLGEHQQTPLYAVRMRPAWQMTNPVIALHNGPNPETAPLLAAVDYISLSDHMSITLPPPLSYRGTGSTAVRLDIVMGWSHYYTFTMEVGTDLRNAHREVFEWRHSYGNAVAALGGAREGWKLVRMSTAPLPGAPRPHPAPGFVSSDGREVVAMYSDARMSMTKQLKFAYVGTGLTGALGERWSVMAATSALAIWEKEEAVRNRH